VFCKQRNASFKVGEVNDTTFREYKDGDFHAKLLMKKN